MTQLYGNMESQCSAGAEPLGTVSYKGFKKGKRCHQVTSNFKQNTIKEYILKI